MLPDTLRNYKIYLVSQSPRRQSLLKEMGIDFDILNSHVQETCPVNMPPQEVVKYLSRLKLSSIDIKHFDAKTIFIACDTIVVTDGRILGKPHDYEEAMNMLRCLSGRTHIVLSGLTTATPQKEMTEYCASEVTFATLEEDELRYYVEHYRPLDKAGAYGVQEWIGHIGISSVSGSFYNVMGLPTRLLWEMLKNIVQ